MTSTAVALAPPVPAKVLPARSAVECGCSSSTTTRTPP